MNSAVTRRTFLSLLALHILIGCVGLVLTRWPIGDFVRYWAMATARGRPYIDYLVEVPPGTLLVFKTIAAVAGTYRLFALTIVTLNIAADLAIARLFQRVWGVRAAVFYAACVIPVLPLVNYRVDLWPTLLATLAFAAWREGKGTASGLASVAGGSLKMWPLALAFWFVVDPAVDRRERVAATRTLAAAGAVFAGAWLLLAGVSGLREVFTFRGARGWEIESSVGAVLNLMHPGAARIESGAWRTGVMTPSVSVVLFVVAGAIMAAIVFTGARARRLGATWIASVGTLLVCSPLFSAQYVLWLAPAAAIAWAEDDRLPAGAAALSIFLTGFYFLFFVASTQGSQSATCLIIIRNVGVLAAVGASIVRLLAPQRVPHSTSAHWSTTPVLSRSES